MGLQLFVYYIVQLEEHRVNINIRWYVHCSDDHRRVCTCISQSRKHECDPTVHAPLCYDVVS